MTQHITGSYSLQVTKSIRDQSSVVLEGEGYYYFLVYDLWIGWQMFEYVLLGQAFTPDFMLRYF